MNDEAVKNSLIDSIFEDKRRDRRFRYIRMVAVTLVAVLVVGTQLWTARKSAPAPVHKQYSSYTGSGVGTASIFVIPVTGMIDGSPLESGSGPSLNPLAQQSSNMVASIRKSLKQADNISDLAEIVLFINSPGGTVTASEEIYGLLKDWKAKHADVSIRSYMYGVGASGAYWIAMATDSIVANPATMVGSIGVIGTSLDISQLAEKFGVKINTFKTGKYKDTGSMWEPLTDEARKYLESTIRGPFDRFLDVVAAGRPALSRAQIEAVADGRVFQAPEAKELGLIDSLSTTFDSFLFERANVIITKKNLARLVVVLPSVKNPSLLDMLTGE